MSNRSVSMLANAKISEKFGRVQILLLKNNLRSKVMSPCRRALDIFTKRFK